MKYIYAIMVCLMLMGANAGPAAATAVPIPPANDAKLPVAVPVPPANDAAPKEEPPRTVNTLPKKAKIADIRILSDEKDFPKHVTANDLAGFSYTVMDKITPILVKSKAVALIFIRYDCSQEGCAVQLSRKGKTEIPILHELTETLKTMNPMKVTGGKVSFQLEIAVY
jgi:hypothetical protein